MKFFAIAALLAATVVALPGHPGDGVGNGGHNSGNSDVHFPKDNQVDVHQVQNSCGNNAKLSCCNKSIKTGDSTTHNQGLLAGAANLGNLLGGNGGSLGIFDQCSSLDLGVSALIGGNVQDLLKKHCQQNIACCQGNSNNQNGAVNVGLPCVDFGSLV